MKRRMEAAEARAAGLEAENARLKAELATATTGAVHRGGNSLAHWLRLCMDSIIGLHNVLAGGVAIR